MHAIFMYNEFIKTFLLEGNMKRIFFFAIVFVTLAMVVPTYAAETTVPKDLPYITIGDVAFIDYSSSDDQSGASASSAKKTFGTARSSGAFSLLTNGGTMVASGKAYIPKNYTLSITKTPLLITSSYAGTNYMNAEPIINPTCAFKMAGGVQFSIESDVIFDDIIVFQEHEVATAFVVKSGATLVIGDGVKSISKTGVKVQIIVENGGRAIVGGGDFDVICESGGEVVENYTYDYLKVKQLVALEEGDYGYYDVTADGKIEIIDVLGVLRDALDNDGTLLRVIRTLKLVTSGEIITPVITEIDTESKNVTLLLGSADEKDYFTVPMDKIGFNEYYSLDFFIGGFATMTVTGDFAESKDLSLLHAAEACSRYDVTEIKLTANSDIAIVNGTEETLDTVPFMQDGELFASTKFLSDKLEENIDGEIVCAATVAESYGAKTTFDAENNTLVIVKQFLPTVTVTNASGKAGEEVSVTVALSHNTGISGVQIELGYDASVLSYTSAQTVSNGMFAQVSPTAGANPFKFVSAHLGLKEVKGDVTFATVNFKIADDAKAGIYPLTYAYLKMFDSRIYNMQVKAMPCSITVTE